MNPILKNLGMSLLIAVTVAAVTVLLFAPRFHYWPGLFILGAHPTPEFDRARFALEQLDNPWAQINSPYHQVIAWRLLFPLTWYYLGLPKMLYLAMPQIGCVLTLWFVAYQSRHKFLTTAVFACLPWFFVSTSWLAYFDSWLILGMLAASLCSNPITIFCCLAVPWIDERFLLAIPAIAFVRFHNQLSLRPLLVVLSYPLLHWYGRDSQAYLVSHWQLVQTVPLQRFGEGLWYAYRAGWIAIFAFLWHCFQTRKWEGLAATGIVFYGTLGVFVAWDMVRTLMILTPLFLIAVWGLEKRIAWAVLAANFLLPVSHVIWFAEWPIRPLWKEMHRETPSLVAAELLNESRTLLDKGQVGIATTKLSEAIALDGTYPLVYFTRALCYIKMELLDKALVDVENGLKVDPKHPDLLYLKGYVYWNRGDVSQAKQILKMAKENAPADWSRLKQVERLLNEPTN